MTNNEGVYHQLVNTCIGVIGDVLAITHCLADTESMGSSSIIRTSFSLRSTAVKFTLNKVVQIGSCVAIIDLQIAQIKYAIPYILQ